MGTRIRPSILHTPKKDILREYDRRHSLYAEFTSTIRALLVDLLNQYQITVHSVSSRLKEKQSLETKLSREGRHYTKIDDITDICGLRIITFYPDQVDSISSLICNEFIVDQKHSVDKRALIDPDRFGYVSVHHIIKLTPSRLRLTENRRFSNCQAEIQVRSILQHAWAEIEHDLGYKNESVVPKQIRRRFSRLASLLELADDEFTRIRDEVSNYTTQITKMIATSPNKVKTDRSTLKVYLETSLLVREINRRIERSTHIILSPTRSGTVDEDTFNRLVYLGLKTIADVNSALTKHKKQILLFAKKLIAPTGKYADKGGYPDDTCLFYLPYAILANERSLKKTHTFVKKFLGGEDEEFVQFIINLKESP